MDSTFSHNLPPVEADPIRGNPEALNLFNQQFFTLRKDEALKH